MGNADDENIELKIADFGLSDEIIPPMTTLFQRCGSPGYIAPEVLRSEGYNFKADVFSLGSVFFNILTRRGLFEGQFRNTKEYLLANKNCDLTDVPSLLKEFPAGGREIIIKMLAIKPTDRLSPEQLL